MHSYTSYLNLKKKKKKRKEKKLSILLLIETIFADTMKCYPHHNVTMQLFMNMAAMIQAVCVEELLLIFLFHVKLTKTLASLNYMYMANLLKSFTLHKPHNIFTLETSSRLFSWQERVAWFAWVSNGLCTFYYHSHVIYIIRLLLHIMYSGYQQI